MPESLCPELGNAQRVDDEYPDGRQRGRTGGDCNAGPFSCSANQKIEKTSVACYDQT